MGQWHGVKTKNENIGNHGYIDGYFRKKYR